MIYYIMLFITSFIWGSAFVAQRVGMDYIGPFTFSTMRYIVGMIVLIPVMAVSKLISVKNNSLDNKNNRLDIRQQCSERTNKHTVNQNTLIGGIVCGIVLFAAGSLQQCGITYIEAGKSGFITALYVVLVPVAGIFIGKKNGLAMWISVLLSFVGLVLLCFDGNSLRIGIGEILTFLCAVFYTIHILVIDQYSAKSNPIEMSFVQFAVCAILSAVVMLAAEEVSWETLYTAAFPIMYVGIFSSGVAYTFQIIAQGKTNPVACSVILCLESVFSALTGWIVLNEKMSVKHIMGCIFMFVATIIAAYPKNEKNCN